MSAPHPGRVLERIERDLREMWSAASAPGELPKTRACTMNLVVVASGEELADRFLPVVDEVTRTLPARVIAVALDPRGQDSLEGDASAVCALGEGSAICSERVRLVARGAMCARVQSAVEALSVTEMPTTLVWLGRVHVDDPVFASLAPSAERLVLDTDHGSSFSGLAQVARWASAQPGRPGLADLAWTRLSLWQELCARFFDEPRLRELSQGVTKLTLTQACDPGARLGAEGALLLGWMATRLGWKLGRLGGVLRFARPDGVPVAVTLKAVARPVEVPPAALARVAIEAEKGGVTLHGAIERELASGLQASERDKDVLVWRFTVEGAWPKQALEQRVRLRSGGSRLVEETLRRPRRDPGLLESVLFLDPLLHDELPCE